MTPEDIQRLIAGAPPGAKIEIVSITLPDADHVVATGTSENVPSSSEEWTEDQIVEYARQTYGEEGLKLEEWVNLLANVSLRELRRAVKQGWVCWSSKGYQRDHAARLITPDSMLTYLNSPNRPRRRRGAR